jgi:FAD/FMN-containing dehydrogenase
MRSLIAELTVIAGSAHVLSEPDVVAGYATDWTRRYAGEASCVVRPGSTEEVAAVLRACAGHGVPVVPQGGNTGLVGGSVPPPADSRRAAGLAAPAAVAAAPVIVSARRLAGLGPVDVAAGQVTAGAGATISAVAAHAAAAGMRYGIDLASRDSATVGGTIATNAGGIRTIRYGPTRAQVAGVTAVLADGSIVSDLSGLTAGSTGYDLAQLLTGSEGTLAVITAARLRLHPAEPAGAVLLAPAAGMAQAVGLYGQIRTGVPGLLAAEYIDGAGLDLLCRITGLRPPLAGLARAYLLVEIAGAGQTAGSAFDPNRVAAAGLPDDSAVETSERGRAALWAYRERLTESIAAAGVPHKIDVAVPVGRLADFRAGLDETVRAAGGGPAEIIVFGHIGVGNLHVNVLGPDPADDRVDIAVARLAAAHGGRVAAEHGVGRSKASWLSWSMPAAQIAAMASIKAALDPAGLLNPGVLLPG